MVSLDATWSNTSLSALKVTLPFSSTILSTTYGFNKSPLLAIEVKALICWIGVVVIPCPNAALKTSVSYLKSTLPDASFGKSISNWKPVLTDRGNLS